MRVSPIFGLVCALALFALPASAQDSGTDSVRQGAESVDSGAHMASDGSAMVASGQAVPGVVSIALGGTSAVAGSAQIALGGGAIAVEASAEGTAAAIDEMFRQPVVITDKVIVAQPPPQVPFEPQARR
jgi:hypothetical protein